jgi:anaphase-promoting complex subunit 4
MIVFLYKTTIPIVNGISSQPTTYSTAISLPHIVVDVKFLNPTVLLILLSSSGSRRWLLARIPATHEGLVWTPYEGQTEKTEPRPFEPRAVEVPIGEDDGFVPVEMEVHPSADKKGPVPGRVCLLGRDRVTLRVFALHGV